MNMNHTTKILSEDVCHLPLGSVFADRYQVIEELGQGGMGCVYKVIDRHIHETVSLKLLKPEVSASQQTIERFQNELKLARKISHKNVCRLYHFGRDNGTYYITMEYVPGEDLRRMIRMTNQISASTAVKIARQVCEGLEEAHNCGIIHRDLKSSNIMLDKDGNARIMDFGLARTMLDEDLAKKERIVGTLEYMAPEQIAGKEVDRRSDIYAVGKILQEMVLGKVRAGGTEEEAIHIPEELNHVIRKCLAPDKQDRYQDIRELKVDLAQLEGELSGSRTAMTHFRLPALLRFKLSLRRGWPLLAGVLAVVAIAVAARFTFLKPMVSGKAAPVGAKKMLVVLPFENLGKPEDEYFADGLTEEITTRLSHIQDLGVISRTSARFYKGTDKSTRIIGEELGVDYVMEGTVRWDHSESDTGRIRVTSQLIRASDDTHLWSESYDRVISDIFSVQSEIADRVIKALDLKVLQPARRSLEAKPTENMQAYNNYLKAYTHASRGWNFSEPEEFKRAAELLEEAIELDPKFQYAYISLTSTHLQAYGSGVDRTPARLKKARDALYEATAIDPERPEVQLAWGFYLYRALKDYDRALEKYRIVQRAWPNFTTPTVGYILRRQGKWEESQAALEGVMEKYPRNADIPTQIGLSCVRLRRYEEAEQWFNRALEIGPEYFPPLLQKATLPLIARGDVETTRDLLEGLGQEHWSILLPSLRAAVFARDFEKALLILESVPTESYWGFLEYFQKNLVAAGIYHLRRQTDLQRFNAEAARIAIEQALKGQAEDARLYAALSRALAYLGEKEEAVRAGIRAVELSPVKADAVEGPSYVANLAEVYAVLGEEAEAIARLEYLLSIPAGNLISQALLRGDPAWDPLRQNPAFEGLLDDRTH